MNLEEKQQSLINAGWDLGDALTGIQEIERGRYQAFQNVSVYENANDGEAYEVHGAIYQKYLEFNETLGDLGFPTSDELDNPEISGGKMSTFEYGIIYWSPFDGAYVQLYPHYELDEFLDWQTILSDKDNQTQDNISGAVSAIRTSRDAVPIHIKPMSKGFGFFGKLNPKPSSIVTDSVEDWIWQEVGSEGSFDSINAYDNMIVTWGKGVSKIHIPKMLKSIFAQNSNIEQAFKLVGIAVSADESLQVVDTGNLIILKNDDAFRYMKVDTKLLDFLANILSNADFQDTICKTQWKFVTNFAPGLISHISTNNWSKDAAQLIFHLTYWLPAYGWIGNSSAYKTTNGDPAKIISIFYKNQKIAKNDLVPKLKIFAGNAFKKYIALDQYRTELPVDQCAIFTDNSITYYVPF